MAKQNTKERELRALMRAAFGQAIVFVEPALGSTFGVPDCFILTPGKVQWAELKLGELNGGNLQFTLRPEQRRLIEKMDRYGIKVFVVVLLAGSKKSEPVVFVIESGKWMCTGDVHVETCLKKGWMKLLCGAKPIDLGRSILAFMNCRNEAGKG